MYLKHLSLQNFRSYTKSNFTFSPSLTVIVGDNAAGKTNLVESLYMLATGKSFKSEKEKQLIRFGENVARIHGIITDEEQDEEDLEIIMSESVTKYLLKKYTVNKVPKRRFDFAGKIRVVLFTPEDLDIVSGQPGSRRAFLNEILEQVDMGYQNALTTYNKALKQRNALLEQAQESGYRDQERFAYWDDLLIRNGQIITAKRDTFIRQINAAEKRLFPFTLIYDSSIISEERLLQYKAGELGAGVTLVGPHRDDVIIQTFIEDAQELADAKYYASRGQQRLITLELKQLQIAYIKEHTGEQPVLLLDDIFSELDSTHIEHVLKMIEEYQTIITTTHHEFIATLSPDKKNVIKLGR